MVNGLLREVLAAHGGIDRWKRYGIVSATIVSGGDLFDAKGLKPDTTPRKVSTATKRERMIAMPFGHRDWKMTFGPERVVIEDEKGAVVAERSNPRDTFAGFWFPTKRRAHPRNSDLTAVRDRTYVWIDVAEVAVGEED
jgi:hypothetical protein